MDGDEASAALLSDQFESGGPPLSELPEEAAPPSPPMEDSCAADPAWYIAKIKKIATEMDVAGGKAKTVARFKAALRKVDGLTGQQRVVLMREFKGVVAASALDPAASKRAIEVLSAAYYEVTGEKLADFGQQLRSPLEKLGDVKLLEMNEEELAAVEKSLLSLPGIPEAKKKRWLDICRRVKACQAAARSDPEAHTVYCMRDWENHSVPTMGAIHHRYYQVWNDPNYPHKLLMASPSHGKSFNFVGQIAWEIAKDPTVRCLLLAHNANLARRDMRAVAGVIRSRLFRALHPDLRLLGRLDKEEESCQRFTILRGNRLSREATMEAYGINSGINGFGYEKIYIDDPVNEHRAREPAYREGINRTFNQVITERLRDPKRASIKIICTPWDPDDLAGMIKREVSLGTRKGWLIADREFGVREDVNGRLISLWPERFSVGFYMQKRAVLPLEQWQRLYKLEAITEAQRIVKRLCYYPEDVGDDLWTKLKPEVTALYAQALAGVQSAEQWLSIDPAATKNKTSTHIGVIQGCITPRGKACIVEAWMIPGDPVFFQKWLVAAISGGIWPAEITEADKRAQPLPHKVDHVICEWNGGMVGAVVLWEDYVRNQLRLIDPSLEMKLGRATNQPKGGGQQQGKAARLSNIASYLAGGQVLLPGRLVFRDDGKTGFVCSNRSSIKELDTQLRDFPTRSTDLVDAVSQWVAEISWKLDYGIGKDVTAVRRAVAKPVGPDPRTEAIRAMLQRLGKPDAGDFTELEKEEQWLRQSA